MHRNSRITQCIFALSFLGAVAGFSSLLAPTPIQTKDTAIRDSVISGIVKTGTVAMTSTDTQYGRRGATAANAGIDTIDTSLTSYFDSVNPMRTISPITGILKSLIPGIGQIADNKSTPTVSTSSINVRENADESGGIDETTERVDVTAAEEEHDDDDDDEPNDEPKRGSLREPTLVAQVDHSRPDLIQASNEQMRQDGEILTTKTREEDDILSKTSFILILVGIFLFTFLLSLCLLWGSYLCTKNKMRT